MPVMEDPEDERPFLWISGEHATYRCACVLPSSLAKKRFAEEIGEAIFSIAGQNRATGALAVAWCRPGALWAGKVRHRLNCTELSHRAWGSRHPDRHPIRHRAGARSEASRGFLTAARWLRIRTAASKLLSVAPFRCTAFSPHRPSVCRKRQELGCTVPVQPALDGYDRLEARRNALDTLSTPPVHMQES
jgi:hypothetical protein